MKVIRTLLVMLVLSVVALGVAVWYGMSTPAYAVREIAASLATCDDARFKRHVDVSKVTGQLVDEALSDKELLKGQGDYGLAIAAGLGAMIKPMLGEMVEKSMVEYVKGCTLMKGSSIEAPSMFAAIDLALSPLAEVLKSRFGAEVLGILSFPRFKSVVNTATLETSFERGGKTHALTLAFLKQDDVWTLIAAPNLIEQLKPMLPERTQ